MVSAGSLSGTITISMAMTNFVSTRCLVLLCSAIILGSSALAVAQKSGLDGAYILDQTDSDNMNEVIEDAVGKLNFLTRDIARGRLKKLNPAYRQVAITFSPNEISVTVDNQPPLRTPANGAPIAWVGPDGGKVNASMQLAGRRLAQTFTSADGRRVNDYTLSPDGRTLTMQVTETSPDCLKLSRTNKFTDECPERGCRRICCPSKRAAERRVMS